jgi:hypothetical protein
MEPASSKAALLDAELEAHMEAVQDFIAFAEQVQESGWNLSRQSDKWSPAQVAEHLRLTYLTVNAELSARGGFRVRTAWWQQRLFKILFLPKILKTGRLPTGVQATREARPSGGPYEKAQLLDALRQEADRFREAVASSSTRTSITHPYLGKLTLLKGIRFLAQHIRHHQRQLPGAIGPTA